MKNTFDVKEYVKDLGKELVFEFTKSKLATQTVAIGSNKESSVVNKLENILPAGVGIGSGFIFDSYGNVSNQCDIILYEKDFCIKCCINGNEKDTYYNCESVIAVGEIKSMLGVNELKDAFLKFKNLNNLQRFKSEKDTGSNRVYLSKMGLSQNFNNEPIERNEYDRIYKFILCEKVCVSYDTIIKNAKETFSCKDEYFNTILDLNGNHFLYLNHRKLTLSPYFADLIINVHDTNSEETFNRFIFHLIHFIMTGFTVPLNYSTYLHNNFDKFNIINSSEI